MFHTYLLLHPGESLIASNLDPASFAAYMATGDKKGSAEALIFVECKGAGFGEFDWDHARRSCDPGDRAQPKRSCYLSIYRCLEQVPLEMFGTLHLVTRDGRALGLAPIPDGRGDDDEGEGPFLYQELCPVRGMIVSSLPPADYLARMTDRARPVSVPKLAFARMHLPHGEGTGDRVPLFDRRGLGHLQHCIEQIRRHGKTTKTVDRSRGPELPYSYLRGGIWIGSDHAHVHYPMPDAETVARKHYHWGRSAHFL